MFIKILSLKNFYFICMSIPKNTVDNSELLFDGNGYFEKSSYLGNVTFIQFITYKQTTYLLSGKEVRN